MDFADRLEDHVPIRAAKICWCTEASDSILFCICIVDHNIGCIICFDFGGEVLF